MNRDTFEKQYADDWDTLDRLLDELEKGDYEPEATRFPELYRRVCQQLALARARSYGTDLERRLNRLALRGHQQLYKRSSFSLRQFVVDLFGDFPRRVREEWKLLLVATLLLYVPQLTTQLAVVLQPELVYSILGPEQARELELMYKTFDARGADDDLLMFGHYIRNNVGIAFRTFASGILLGLGSIFFLVFNGIFFGAAAGHIQNVELGHHFFPFVIGHGSFEITAIILAGQCGLLLGFSLLMPGRNTRIVALRNAALRGLPILYGLTVFLFVAAFIEAFWSSTPTPPVVRYSVGSCLWALVLGYLFFGGRSGGRSVAAPSSDRAVDGSSHS